jgi:hypothetical protein
VRWKQVSFVRSTRAILERCIREKGIELSPDGRAALDALPATFDAWKGCPAEPIRGRQEPREVAPAPQAAPDPLTPSCHAPGGFIHPPMGRPGASPRWQRRKGAGDPLGACRVSWPGLRNAGRWARGTRTEWSAMSGRQPSKAGRGMLPKYLIKLDKSNLSG